MGERPIRDRDRDDRDPSGLLRPHDPIPETRDDGDERGLTRHSNARGLAVIVGCSHPGVEKIVAEAAKIDPRIYTVAGGFHLVLMPREEIQRTADALYSDLNVERVAPGHCTSEKGFAVFLDRFKERFDRAGLGAVVAFP